MRTRLTAVAFAVALTACSTGGTTDVDAPADPSPSPDVTSETPTPTRGERAAELAEEACGVLEDRFVPTGGGLSAMVDLYDEAHDLLADAADLDRRWSNLAEATRGARDNSAAVERAVASQTDLDVVERLSSEMGEYSQRMAAGCQAIGVDVPATAFDQ